MSKLHDLVEENRQLEVRDNNVGGMKSRQIIASLHLFSAIDMMYPIDTDHEEHVRRRVLKGLSEYLHRVAYGHMLNLLFEIRRGINYDKQDAIDAWDELYGSILDERTK